MNSRLESKRSFHQAWTQTDYEFPTTAFLDVIKQDNINMAKHLAETSTNETIKLGNSDTDPNKMKKQGLGLNARRQSQLEQEINSIRQVVQEQDSRLKMLEQLLGTSTTLHYVRSLEEKVNILQQTMEDFTIRLTSLEDGNEREEMSLNDLSSKVDSIDLTLGNLESERENEEYKLKEFEGRLLEAEANRRKDWSFYQQKLADVENLYRQICEMMAGHVRPLRRLQDTLNNRVQMTEKRNLMASQLESISDTVMDLLPRVSNLESRGRHGTVGFTAYLPLVTRMTTSGVLKEFTDVCCNEGSCYNPANGMFTAPQDGLYFVSVTLRQRKEGAVDVNVLARRRASGNLRIVGKSGTHSDKKCSTAVSVVKLKAGDVLFVKAVSVVPEASLSQYSSFTCYMIG
ncbi:unnamed protein product [Candidula unifasciata]|uniref:C1q domain-containing protein n=1 Tax=Candidula unifasciata TaxID=100452 RepID=A0A8S3ZQ71_9EUPU|nr:unnamed protein product [Candidula unifasciata]